MTLLAPQWLLALGAVPVLGVLLAVAYSLRKRALRRFFGTGKPRPWATSTPAWLAATRAAALLLGLALIAVALSRPGYDPKPRKVSRAGRDVVFVVDVSRSMLAQDIRPNRLERAKLAIRDVLDTVEGDRVGLIAFAGTAVLKCPLTTDYAFARLALDEIGPDSVSRGGTAIGSAIRAATDLLEPPDAPTTGLAADAARADSSRFRDVFIFTDGEDHETKPEEAAKSAGEKGIRLITVGLGSELDGAPVPVADQNPGRQSAQASTGYMQYQGERVQSKLNPESLRKIAEAGAPGGMFLNVGVGNIELDRIYKRLMREAERRTLDDTLAIRYTEAFQLALAAALALLCLEPLLMKWRR